MHMFNVRAWLAVLLGLVLLASACGGEVTDDAGEDGSVTAASDDAAEDSGDDSSSEDATTDDAGGDDDAGRHHALRGVQQGCAVPRLLRARAPL